jgi:hypothetical protein
MVFIIASDVGASERETSGISDADRLTQQQADCAVTVRGNSNSLAAP